MGTTAGVAIVTFVSFFSWLGITTVNHGQRMAAMEKQLEIIIETQRQMKISFLEMPQKISSIESSLSELKTRIDRIEDKIKKD